MMFSQSQYDNGFSSSQFTQSDSTPSPAKSRDLQGTIPVTVKQISQASHSNAEDKSSFNLDGVDVTNVKLVGMVLDKTEKVTDVSFTLDDGTGRIGCKRWLNEPFDRKQMEVIEEGMYVRLVGHLRNTRGYNEIAVFNMREGMYVRLVGHLRNTRGYNEIAVFNMREGMYVRLVGHLRNTRGYNEIAVFNMRPIINFNKVTLHHVECIHQHIVNHKSQKGDSLTQGQTMESLHSTLVKVESNGIHSSPPNQFSMQMSVDGLKDVDQRILDYLMQSSSLAQEKGVHRDEIARHLKIPVEKLMESIPCLEDEGLIYSTIDEFHFKPTAA